jgi:hypothetical protein
MVLVVNFFGQRKLQKVIRLPSVDDKIKYYNSLRAKFLTSQEMWYGCLNTPILR